MATPSDRIVHAITIDQLRAAEQRVAELEATLRRIAVGKEQGPLNMRQMDRHEMRTIAECALKGEGAK